MRFKRLTWLVMTQCCLLAALNAAAVAHQKSLKALFRELQEEATTDAAFRQFSERSPDDRAVIRFLSRNLPAVLNAAPKIPKIYLNNVQLAGNFRIVSAIPGLIAEITCTSEGGSTLSSRSNLTSSLCAHALVQIGDPAVPALTEILTGPDRVKRLLASRALALIGSPRSLAVLRDYLAHDPDPDLKSEIEYAVSHPK
jgi:hypothetical protein